MYTVNLTYFKDSGKYYSGGCYDSEKAQLFEIFAEVRQKVIEGKLPGLMKGHSPFHVLIDVPDHQNRHFHLVPIDPELENRIKCAECGSLKVTTKEKMYRFPYGIKKQAVELRATVPVRTCEDCGFQFLDCEAEDIIDKRIQEYIKR